MCVLLRINKRKCCYSWPLWSDGGWPTPLDTELDRMHLQGAHLFEGCHIFAHRATLRSFCYLVVAWNKAAHQSHRFELTIRSIHNQTFQNDLNCRFKTRPPPPPITQPNSSTAKRLWLSAAPFEWAVSETREKQTLSGNPPASVTMRDSKHVDVIFSITTTIRQHLPPKNVFIALFSAEVRPTCRWTP